MNKYLIDSIQDLCGDAHDQPNDPFGYVRILRTRLDDLEHWFNKEMRKHGHYNRQVRGSHSLPKPPAPSSSGQAD